MNTALKQQQFDELKAIAEQYSLPEYYVWSFEYFLDQVDFRGKRVLEIGGSSLPKELFDSLAVEQWICVDILDHDAGGYQTADSEIQVVKMKELECIENDKYAIIDGDMCDFPVHISDHFDVIVTVNCMEHVINMSRFLRAAHNTLKIDGEFLASFGPLWSCAAGSHFWGATDWDFNKPGSIEEWDHLLLRPAQLLEKIIASGVDAECAENVIVQIYHSPRINRLFYSDYVAYLNNSSFRSYDVTTHYRIDPNPEKLKALQTKYGADEDFSAYSLIATAVK